MPVWCGSSARARAGACNAPLRSRWPTSPISPIAQFAAQAQAAAGHEGLGSRWLNRDRDARFACAYVHGKKSAALSATSQATTRAGESTDVR